MKTTRQGEVDIRFPGQAKHYSIPPVSEEERDHGLATARKLLAKLALVRLVLLLRPNQHLAGGNGREEPCYIRRYLCEKIDGDRQAEWRDVPAQLPVMTEMVTHPRASKK